MAPVEAEDPGLQYERSNDSRIIRYWLCTACPIYAIMPPPGS